MATTSNHDQESLRVDDHKRDLTIAALTKHRGNRTYAAKELNVSVRTIRYWIQRFQLSKRFPFRRGSVKKSSVDARSQK